MYRNIGHPIYLLDIVIKNRNLIFSLIRREVLGRYHGSFLGIIWPFLNPLFSILVYTFVFSFVFKAKWNIQGNTKIEFAIILFSGLMVFNLFSECIARSPNLVVSNSNYVKKVVFPLEILPIVDLGAALFHFFISFLTWVIFSTLFFSIPPKTIFLLPLIVLPLLFLTLGLSWILASLGVYLRDLNQLISLLLTGLMFLTPIFYPLSSIPSEYQSLMLLNPLTKEVEMVRDALIFGKLPSWFSFLSYFLINVAIALVGFVWFQKTKKGFSDVL